jgi:protein-S-isoprenylcysteine O-methyltransferase Ste14
MIFTILFFIFVIAASIEGRRAVFLSKEKPERIDKEWAMFIPLVTYIMIISAGVVEYFISGRQMNFTVSLLGLVVFIIGRTLRNLSISTLGRSWSIHVKSDNVECVIKKGPYRYTRHPYYLGSLVVLSGVLLIANSYYSFLLVIFIQAPLYFIRMRIEEKELSKKFGTEYSVYKKETPLFPRIKKAI